MLRRLFVRISWTGDCPGPWPHASVTQTNGDINGYSEQGFEPATKVFEQSSVLHALDRGATLFRYCTTVPLIFGVLVLIANRDLRGTEDG
jgi:hypothetical protein